MNKSLAMFALLLLLCAGGCTTAPAEQPEPLVLPYPLYEQEFEGNQVTVTLETSPDGPAPYAFNMAAHIAEGEPRFGVYVIQLSLTEGYRPDMAIDWTERLKDQTGTGGVWEREDLAAIDVDSSSAFGLGGTDKHPVAVFVRVVATSRDHPGVIREERHGPVAVLQILPDGQGVVRLDP